MTLDRINLPHPIGTVFEPIDTNGKEMQGLWKSILESGRGSVMRWGRLEQCGSSPGGRWTDGGGFHCIITPNVIQVWQHYKALSRNLAGTHPGSLITQAGTLVQVSKEKYSLTPSRLQTTSLPDLDTSGDNPPHLSSTD